MLVARPRSRPTTSAVASSVSTSTRGAVEDLYTEVRRRPAAGTERHRLRRRRRLLLHRPRQGRGPRDDGPRSASTTPTTDGSSVTRDRLRAATRPNGIAPRRADGRQLYVAETHTGRLWSWDVESPGVLRRRRSPRGRGTLLHNFDGYQLPGWFEEELMERNAAMLAQPPRRPRTSAPLEHVSLLQGTKAYGVHHPDDRPRPGAPAAAARAGAARARAPQLLLAAGGRAAALRQAGAGWALTILRPTVDRRRHRPAST